MKYQRASIIKLAITLVFLSLSGAAISEPISYNTLTSGSVSRASTKTLITLSLAPAFEVNNSEGTNGPLSGLIEGSDGIVPDPAMHAENMQMGKSIENSKIRISIPLIDYGYTGTFYNVCIKVRGKNKERYATTELGTKTRCIGTVTIEIYTRFELKGAYSGGLTNLDFEPRYAKINSQVNNGFASGEPINNPPVAGSIKGEFYILDPWRNDSRFSLDKEVFIDAAENDLKGMASQFGVIEDLEKAFDEVRSNQRQNDNRASQGGDVEACDCSCNYVISAAPECKAMCGEAFAICTEERYEPQQNTVANKNTDDSLPPKQDLPKAKGAKLQGIDQDFVDELEKGAVKTPENLREKFILILQKNHPGDENASMRDMMIKGFDSMPDDKSKMIMFESMGGN